MRPRGDHIVHEGVLTWQRRGSDVWKDYNYLRVVDARRGRLSEVVCKIGVVFNEKLNVEEETLVAVTP